MKDSPPKNLSFLCLLFILTADWDNSKLLPSSLMHLLHCICNVLWDNRFEMHQKMGLYLVCVDSWQVCVVEPARAGTGKVWLWGYAESAVSRHLVLWGPSLWHFVEGGVDGASDSDITDSDGGNGVYLYMMMLIMNLKPKFRLPYLQQPQEQCYLFVPLVPVGAVRLLYVRVICHRCLGFLMCTQILMHVIVYGGCHLMGTPNSVIQPLQKIQNFAARLVLLAPRHHHSTPLLEKIALASHFRAY